MAATFLASFFLLVSALTFSLFCTRLEMPACGTTSTSESVLSSPGWIPVSCLGGFPYNHHHLGNSNGWFGCEEICPFLWHCSIQILCFLAVHFQGTLTQTTLKHPTGSLQPPTQSSYIMRGNPIKFTVDLLVWSQTVCKITWNHPSKNSHNFIIFHLPYHLIYPKNNTTLAMETLTPPMGCTLNSKFWMLRSLALRMVWALVSLLPQ